MCAVKRGLTVVLDIHVHVHVGAISEHGVRTQEFLFSSWASVKIKKLMGKNGRWVGGSETILHEDGFFNFSIITDDPLAT